MRNSVLQLCADISRHPPPLRADVIAESRALLSTWRRTISPFSAMRESRLRRGRSGPELVPVPGTRTGLLRRRLSGAHARRAGRQYPPRAALARAADHHQGQSRARPCIAPAISTTSASNASTHAAGRSARRAFSASGPRSAYAADPRQVPWLRLKLKQRDRALSVRRPTATTASACRRSSRRCRAMSCSRPASPDLIRVAARCWCCRSARACA